MNPYRDLHWREYFVVGQNILLPQPDDQRILALFKPVRRRSKNQFTESVQEVISAAGLVCSRHAKDYGYKRIERITKR